MIGGLSGRRGYPKRRTVWCPFLVGLVSREFTSDLGMTGFFFGIVPVCLNVEMLYNRDEGDVLRDVAKQIILLLFSSIKCKKRIEIRICTT